jgi:hypothetical protein
MQINFNGFGFNPFENMENVIVEIQLGNQVVEQNQMPLPFAKQQFAQLVKQISRDPRPMQAKCYLDDYTEDGKRLANYLAFQNTSFMREFEKKGETNEG